MLPGRNLCLAHGGAVANGGGNLSKIDSIFHYDA